MIGAAESVVSVVLAVDRQTVMLRAFWTLVVAAGLVSIGAWLLLAREVRFQRRRRASAATDGADAEALTAGDAEAVAPAEAGADAPAAHAVEVPPGTAEVGDRGDHP